MMRHGMITLFGEAPTARRGPSVFIVSMVLHGAVISSIYFGFRHAVKVEDQALVRRYTVRLLSLVRPLPKAVEREESRPSQASHTGAMAAESGGHGSPSVVLPQQANLIHAPQTIVQPDLPPNLLLKQAIRIPLALIWSPQNNVARIILPPPPQEQSVAVRPDLTAPNREIEIASVKVSANSFVTDLPAPAPSSTSPIATKGAETIKQVAETGSKPLGPVTPARVFSVSDLNVEHATIALPAVNEVAAVGAANTLAAIGPVVGTSSGSGKAADKAADKADGSGRGDGPHDASGQSRGLEGRGDETGASVAGGGGGNQSAEISGSGQPAVTRVLMPKDGKFGVVVVGSSVAEAYPEVAGLWGNRMAYTVYLHVGLAKNWIMQYSLPPDADKGPSVHMDAPWPFVMERPELAPGDLDGDAVMVHGFVNAAGRFERLSIVSPADFAQTKFVLAALQGWQFRAAMENGVLTMVEVLLIIPSQTT